MRLATEQRSRCRSRHVLRWTACAFAGMAVLSAAHAAPLLHAVFQDHVVLQRDKPINLWGEASPGETLSVSLAGQTVQASADQSGRWQVTMPPLHAGGPHEISVHTRIGAEANRRRCVGRRCMAVLRPVEHGPAGASRARLAGRDCELDE